MGLLHPVVATGLGGLGLTVDTRPSNITRLVSCDVAGWRRLRRARVEAGKRAALSDGCCLGGAGGTRQLFPGGGDDCPRGVTHPGPVCSVCQSNLAGTTLSDARASRVVEGGPGPGGDAAVVRVHGTNKALAITTDCTPRYCEINPIEGGKQAVAEAWRNLTAVGARPLAVTDNMNFGNPEKPEIMGQFAGCIQGMAEACRALDFPVVSGNVSLYNETGGRAILPTPVIGGVGLIDNVANIVSLAFRAEEQSIVLIGETCCHVGMSLYLRVYEISTAGTPPPVDLKAERRNGDFVRVLMGEGHVSACHDISDGGLLVAVAEMALAGDVGAEIALPDGGLVALDWLFGEDQGRYIIQTADEDAVLKAALCANVPAIAVGRTGGTSLTVGGHHSISVSTLREAHEGWLPGYMAFP